MEKESKIMICSDDGEWGREPTQKLSQRGVRALFLKRDSSLLLSKIREERPQLVIMDFLMPGLDAIGVIHAVAQDANVENPLYHSDLLLHQPHDGAGNCRRWRCLFRPVPL